MSIILVAYFAMSDAFNLHAPNFYSHLGSLPSMPKRGTTKTGLRQSLKIYSAPAKYSDSYDLDAIEEEIMSEQSLLQPNNKSIRSKRRQKGKRRNAKHSTLPTEPTANKTSNTKKGRRRSKKFGSASSAPMPPWLAQYENEDFAGPFYLAEESQSAYYSVDGIGSTYDNENEQIIAPSQMQRLQFALNGIFYHPPTNNNVHPTATDAGTVVPEAIPYFTPSEIYEVMDAIHVASHDNSKLMAGCADFLYLMLTLEEEGVLTSDFLSSEPWDDDADVGTEDNMWENGAKERGRRPEPQSIMTRDVLVAAAFHYCDCVRARKAGVYDYARQAMEASLDMSIWKELEKKKQLWLPPAVENTGDGDATTSAVEDSKSIVVSTMKKVTRRGQSPIEHYGEGALKIAASAARLKRAEIMATTVNSNGSQTSRGDTNPEILRSFLVSLSEDWRALVIRSAACLYRLKGIVDDGANGDETGKSTGSVILSTTNINTARDALSVYGPLAQRMGMQRLKTELENTAFKLLYPRQFSVASSLYNGDIDEMKSIVRVLSSRIEQLLKSDPVFIDHSDVTVSSRVKEPYSLWKKILRYRKEIADAKNNASENIGDRQSVPATLSLKWVPDAIAFRVVLRGVRLSPLEDDESLRTREKMLCYYALQLISDVWPASTINEAKDYIKNPKPNGYQSLHYTASLMITGEEWPFEVQIRSEEMHRIAEFGVAAHWDYKLQNKVIKSLPGKPLSQLALPSAGNSTRILAETQSVAVEVNMTETLGSSSRVAQKGRIASYIEALTTSRETIVHNNMFVFLSSTKSALDGRIVSIDPSACNVADVLEKYDILDDISDGTFEIYQNGVSTSLDDVVSNGDVLTLPSIIIDKLNA